ncbi:hypothetical protein AALA00_13700 [Lachnospiraceae bacterium 46-15]
MSKNQNKEYAKQLKLSSKELIDGIGTDSEIEQKVIKLIYGFVRSGFLECRAQKGGTA